MKQPTCRVPATFVAVALFIAIHNVGFAFDLPSPEDTRRALGSLAAEPFAVQRLLEPDEDFPRLEQPGPGDWLSEHEEKDQTFYDFVSSDARVATADRKTIYLQPLEEFHEDSAPSLAALQDYAQAFFQLDVVLLPAALVDDSTFQPRIHPQTRKVQYLTTPILAMLASRLPTDAFCLIAVTMTDLYPAENWNFVFGQASPHTRTGVFSFARDDPGFFGRERPDDIDVLRMRRSCKTLVHEIGHIFGLGHCIHFRCAENGVNHAAESDSRPQYLCPLCLRKLQFATRMDLERRYRDLAYFYSQHSWTEDEAWVRRQIAKLRVAAPSLTPPAFETAPEALPPPQRGPVPIPAAPTPDVPDAPPASPSTEPPATPDTAPAALLPAQLVAQCAFSRV